MFWQEDWWAAWILLSQKQEGLNDWSFLSGIAWKVGKQDSKTRSDDHVAAGNTAGSLARGGRMDGQWSWTPWRRGSAGSDGSATAMGEKVEDDLDN